MIRGLLPAALDALEKNNTHTLLTTQLTRQLRTLEPHQQGARLIAWILEENRYRQLLSPVLVQLASALSSNKSRIEQAAGNKAPLTRVPLLGRLSRALAEDLSERTTNNVEARLLAASEDETEPLWDLIHEQLLVLHDQLRTNPELARELTAMRDNWLDSPRSGELGKRVWCQLRSGLEQDLRSEQPAATEHLAALITAAGSAVSQKPGLAARLEATMLDGVERILARHGEHIETMIRQTIGEWDADTLMQKLEQQVGPDLQFIRINGTLIGGLGGIILHAVGSLVW